ncbi:anthranilate synthase component I family protein [Francisellaceae bacterium]|nr:anthranilate synthase component I family protein [Francisellaceae bacterium]
MIKVISSSKKLETHFDSFALFESLKNKYSDEELFLLESLSGPNKDVSKSVIGFNPIFGVEFHVKKFKLKGSERIKHKVDMRLKSEDWIESLNAFEYQLLDAKDMWKVLRLMESLFSVQYEGAQKDIAFGYFGYIGYDAIHAIEEIPYTIKDDKSIPILNFNIYQGMFNIDLEKRETFLTINTSDDFDSNDTYSEMMGMLEAPVMESGKSGDLDASISEKINSITDSITKQEYLKLVDKAMDHIELGDIYQIQLGHEIEINSDIEPYAVYKRLRTLNPSPYMYYTALSSQHIIGASPELFLRLDKDDNITMRPIAGTVKIGATPEENKILQQNLLNDEKERAEHIMLVDLCRNDVGRVCKKNTLEVDELMVIEQYSHVSHIVSNVIGKKAAEYDKYDVISATFPAGTMTGAPKVRAMEIIEDFENTRRGIYAGLLGFIGFNGIVETALCIRTATYQDNVYTIRASGGVVSDSTPIGEWNESISKLSATYFAITDKELRNENFIN